MNTWFTSDTHFGHTNIIDYCNRPFVMPRESCKLCDENGMRWFRDAIEGKKLAPCIHPDVKRHDETLIERWNERVAPDDIVYHLGDFAMGNFAAVKPYVEKLNGRKVLIVGNHDRMSHGAYRKLGFRVYDKLVLGSVHLQHRPPPWNEAPRGTWLVGHVHGMYAEHSWVTRPGSRLVNVGVDVRDFRPVSARELGVNPNLLVG